MSEAYTGGATASIQLLDLPNEILTLICHFAALQKFEYGESRRPRPSALVNLTLSCRRLRSVTDPFRFHTLPVTSLRRNLVYTEPLSDEDEYFASIPPWIYTTKSCEQDDLELYGSHGRHAVISDNGYLFSYERLATYSPVITPMPTLKSLMVRYGPMPITGISLRLEEHLSMAPNAHTVVVRKCPWTEIQLDNVALTTALVSLTLLDCPHTLLAPLNDKSPNLRHLTIVATALVPFNPYVVNWATESLWRKLRSFSFTAPQAVDSLQRCFAYLEIPPDAPLESLSLAIALPKPHERSPPLTPFPLAALAVFRHLPRLTSLKMDIWASISPDDVEKLAEAFPRLTVLEFEDRTVWCPDFENELVEEHIAALSNFKHLVKLCLPLSVDPDTLSAALPTLRLIGLCGQSETQWYRVVEAGVVEGTSFVDMDLARV